GDGGLNPQDAALPGSSPDTDVVEVNYNHELNVMAAEVIAAPVACGDVNTLAPTSAYGIELELAPSAFAPSEDGYRNFTIRFHNTGDQELTFLADPTSLIVVRDGAVVAGPKLSMLQVFAPEPAGVDSHSGSFAQA